MSDNVELELNGERIGIFGKGIRTNETRTG